MNVPAIISVAADYMIVSNLVYEIFVRHVMKSYIERKLCKEVNLDVGEVIKSIECHDGINATDFGEIYSMIINGVQFDFPTGPFFDKLYDNMLSNRVSGRKVHNFTGIILGPQFISLFNYSVFDYENKQIKFYSDRYKLFSLYKHNIIKVVFIFIMVLLVINYLYMIYIIMNK